MFVVVVTPGMNCAVQTLLNAHHATRERRSEFIGSDSCRTRERQTSESAADWPRWTVTVDDDRSTRAGPQRSRSTSWCACGAARRGPLAQGASTSFRPLLDARPSGVAAENDTACDGIAVPV